MRSILLFLATIVISQADNVPFYFPKCNIHDEKLSRCLADSANFGWSQFAKDYNFTRIPVDSTKVIPNFITASIKGYISGFKDILFHDIYVNFDKKSFDIIYSQPELQIVSNYKMDGSFLEHEIHDSGKTKVFYYNAVCMYHFDYETEVGDDDEEYINLTTFNLSIDTNNFRSQFSSEQDKDTGAMITNLFNNKWRILNILSKNALEEVVSEAYTPLLREFLRKVPIKNLFQK